MGRLSSRARSIRGARLAAFGVGSVGLAMAVLVAADASMSAGDTSRLVSWAIGSAALGGALAALALRLTRHRTLALQLALVTCSTALVVSAGAWLGARRMFLSAHDLSALAVLLLAAGTVGCVMALLLGDRVAIASDALVAATRRLADGEVLVGTAPGVSGDLRRLAHELEATSARLDEARRREQAMERSRRDLVAWVSHDLRTPLAGIRAIAEALEDEIPQDAETLARYHATLRAEAEQLSGLVDDLFELSRAQSGVLHLELARLSLVDLVSDAIAGVAPVAANKRVNVEGRFSGQSAHLAGSAPELLRALRNILENAVRHTPADGSVVVEAGRRGGDAFVTVRDDGGGIPEAAIPRLFDIGFRVDSARTPGDGAGLGLAIARSFVEAHDGRITVSNENGGACFTIWLPLAPPEGGNDDASRRVQA